MQQDIFRDQRAVITGASGGIGKAVALGLGSRGATVCLVGRDAPKLAAVREQLLVTCPQTQSLVCDLGNNQETLELSKNIVRTHDRVDMLVHCAGTIALGSIESAPVAQFENQYRINALAPALLTQGLLPLLKKSLGQIVFVNSSVGLRSKKDAGAYAASKHALHAIADTFRLELNPHGVRVLTVYPGDTATAMQQTVQSYTGRHVGAEYLMQPDDVASVIIHALQLPRTAEITDVHMRPFRKAPE